MRAFVVLVLVLGLAAGAAAQVTVKGDAAAWREVTAAYEKLGTLRSYRMKITTAGQPTAMVIERVNPDRSRSLIQAEGVTIESIAIGSETRFRMTGPNLPGGWQCNRPPGPAGAPPDPKTARGEVTISRLADSTIERARTRGYQYTWTSEGQPTRQRLFVLVEGGLPRRLEVFDNADKVQSTIDYYDFNAPITIELPRCG